MYLGQETWAQKGGGRFQAQPPRGGRPAGAGEVGQVQRFSVSGCKHAVVGPIVCGDFVLNGSNHGKPAYKKTAAANGLPVLIYFWDERDGAASSGWWIGPEIGGNMVWGHHPNRSSSTPPSTGWQAPHSGPPDAAMVLTPAGSAPAGGFGHGSATAAFASALPPQSPAQAAVQARLQQQRQTQQQQMEEQRRKMAEMGQQRALEMQRKQQEMATRRAQEMRRAQEEQGAVMAIRNCVKKVRAATPDNFDMLKEQLAQTLAQQFDRCGAQKAKLQEESDSALDQASKRIEEVKEKRAKAEETRKEMERKRQESVEKAIGLLGELTDLAQAAEESAGEVKAGVAEFAQRPAAEEGDEAAQGVEKLVEAAAGKAQACQEFLKAHSAELRALPPNTNKPPPPPDKSGEDKEEEPAEAKPTLQSLQKVQLRITASKHLLDTETRGFRAAVEAARKKAVAAQEMQRVGGVFKKYDKDKDGALNKKEIQVYAKTEFKFTVPDIALDNIFKAIAQDGKGVKEADFHRLTVAVGVARERARDLERRKLREAREKELAEQKATAQAKLDEVTAAVKAVEAEVAEANKQSRTLATEGKGLSSTEMLAKAGEVEAAVKATAEKVAAATKAAAAVEGTEVDAELKKWFDLEVKRAKASCASLEAQTARALAAVEKFRGEATRKDAIEVRELASRVVLALKTHQTATSLTSDALFEAIAPKGADGFGGKELAAFIGGLPKPDGEEARALTGADVERAFGGLDEERGGSVSKAAFECLLMVLMKVVKDVAITDGLSIKEAKTLRRLECGEVLQVIEGPVKEQQTEVERVRAKAMKDDVEGWVTVAGNQGSLFLKPGADFKVIKETILTEGFEIEMSKDETRKIKESTRKLKPGELIELRGIARKQEDTGLTRMKCKVKSDGSLGYVTTVGNTGIKFVEVA